MANTKKTTTSKAKTTAKKAEPAKKVVKDAEVEETKVVKKETIPSLKDTDEIEVMALIPNVSYKSNATGDMYSWKDIGDIEMMPFEEIKSMWRNYKGYFRNLWLKPLDERVFKQLRLGKIYDEYDFLMNEDSYNRDNIDDVVKAFENVSSGVRMSVVILIKRMVSEGKLNDVKTIRALEKHLGIDLISLLD